MYKDGKVHGLALARPWNQTVRATLTLSSPTPLGPADEFRIGQEKDHHLQLARWLII